MKLVFDNPEFISASKPDTLKVKFSNANIFLEPVDPDLAPVPPGFEQVVKLPPQSPFLMSEKEVKSVKSSG
jgi:hypothetical protein